MANRAHTKLSEPREITRSMRKQHGKRTDEVRGTVEGLRSEFNRRVDDVRGAAESLRQEYDDKVDQVHVQIDQSIDDSRKTVQKHPFLAIGVTLGAGIVAGVLLGRKTKA
jgi:ElaB/YqjD/DUF883 family membrane-anchored ribosome-binding protein